MASRPRRTRIAVAGLVLVILAFGTVVLSMTTPNWIESLQERKTGFGRLGLWEACFDNYVNEKDSMGKRYNGCHHLFSFEYRTIFKQINPEWLLVVQVLMVLSLIIIGTILTFVIMHFIKCCPVEREKCFMMSNFVLCFIAGSFEAVCIILFGIQADNDRQWLPHPDSNYLSWSFGMAVLSALFILFCGMCLLVEWMWLKQDHRNKVRRQNMALTTHPVSRY